MSLDQNYTLRGFKKLTPGQKQLETLLLVIEDPGNDISSNEQGPKMNKKFYDIQLS